MVKSGCAVETLNEVDESYSLFSAYFVTQFMFSVGQVLRARRIADARGSECTPVKKQTPETLSWRSLINHDVAKLPPT